ncbi:hypothetical protein PtB15_12B528 [Puccinia triticina]|nr:hypothetical protein PtB15_12B528 [Puccinia triticina]
MAVFGRTTDSRVEEGGATQGIEASRGAISRVGGLFIIALLGQSRVSRRGRFPLGTGSTGRVLNVHAEKNPRIDNLAGQTDLQSRTNLQSRNILRSRTDLGGTRLDASSNYRTWTIHLPRTNNCTCANNCTRSNNRTGTNTCTGTTLNAWDNLAARHNLGG